MSLDRRAERAVRSLRASLADVSPVEVPTVVRRHRFALAGGFAGLVLLAGLTFAFVRMLPSEPDPTLADSIPTSIPPTTSTRPDQPSPGLIPGDPSPTVTSPVVTPTPAPTTTDPSDTTSTTLPSGPGPLAVTAAQTIGSSGSADPAGSYAGTAPPGTPVTADSAYGSASTTSDGRGEWSLTIDFDDVPIGESFPVTVTVGSRAFTFTYTWTYLPPATALQQYGSSDAESPTERFSGTAPPGTEVVAASSYGSESTIADHRGRWSLDLSFADLPTGASFPISVTVGDREFGFTFTWTHTPVTTAEQLIGSSDEPEPYDRFSGIAPEGTSIRIESIYGSASGVADEHGEWSLEVRFDKAPPWEHFEQFPVAVYVGEDRFDFTFTWTYQPSPTAEQQYGSSVAPSPFDRFSGQAPPGTTVTATSDYGSASTVADGETGEWTLEVYFSDPPVGEPFPVTVTAGGETFPFSFVWEPVQGDLPSTTSTSPHRSTTPSAPEA